MYQADGQAMKILGRSDVEVTLGLPRVNHRFLVENLHVDAILGMDYLTDNECKLNIPDQVMNIGGSDVYLWGERDYVQELIIKLEIKCGCFLQTKRNHCR